MFDKILVANRGEIACRVMRTATRMGIRTVAVYSDADAESRHVAMADEAYYIGPAPASQSYLKGDLVLEAARQSGALAIHPGYGFLSENAGFARDCADAGFVFVGPPVAAIEAMGSKSAAKNIMSDAGVPLVPGYHGDDQDPDLLKAEADKIGYPVLLKASAGGGGKGMRVVESPDGFYDALNSAKREALAGFGDDNMLIEKYLARPRHVEIQVFADSHGNVLHLFERDCSIQRRHQKVIEEAPAPGMSSALRRKMGDTAVAAAQAIGYVGAGTVEFLLDEDGSFYFMEMNTRLQVEHPVTEMITGQDLVEWQVRVAAGEHLPCKQDDLSVNGHSLEARVYAEDPSRDFLPATGRLSHLRTPAESANVRIETGVREGDEVSVHYDPMIAKLVVWDTDRPAAIRRMRTALAEYQVVGLTTNLEFLASVAAHPAFLNGDLDTHFIDRHAADLFPTDRAAADNILALACLDLLLRRGEDAKRVAKASADPYSPWHMTDGWRMNDDNHHEIVLEDGDRTVDVTIHYRADRYVMELPGGNMDVSGSLDASGDLMANLGGVRVKATVARQGSELTILCHGRAHRLELFDAADRVDDTDATGGRLTAPMTGKVVAVSVSNGATVSKGDPLMILEAMKMEHTIAAPADGVVKELHYAVGDQVDDGAELLEFEAAES